MAAALGRVAEEGDLRVHSEHLGGPGTLHAHLRELVRRGERDVAVFIEGVRIVDIYGAVAHDEGLVPADHHEAGGHEVRAGLGLYELQRGADRIRGGVGGAAEQGVRLAHLDQHGAEVVRLLEGGGAVLAAELALAQREHRLDHLGEVRVIIGVYDLQAVYIEAALGRGGLDLGRVADEHRREEAAGLEPCGALEDTGVRSFGVDYLPGVFLEYFNKILKHCATASILIWRTLRLPVKPQFYHPAPRFASPEGGFTRGFEEVIILFVIKMSGGSACPVHSARS